MIDDQDKRDRQDYERQRAMEKAIEGADRIIVEAADGDNDLLMCLTVEMAHRWVQKTKMMIQAQYMRKDLLQRSQGL